MYTYDKSLLGGLTSRLYGSDEEARPMLLPSADAEAKLAPCSPPEGDRPRPSLAPARRARVSGRRTARGEAAPSPTGVRHLQQEKETQLSEHNRFQNRTRRIWGRDFHRTPLYPFNKFLTNTSISI